MHYEERDPLWYKDAIIYELHVRGFYDSDADGIGDFRGLTQKLDYLQDLGVTALWLLPFYPSPLRDDGYDIADYRGVHPDYGSLRDFREFLQEAHRRGLRVITELVLNHTSEQHPWFQHARRAPPDSQERRFYVWSDTTERYRQARIIFKDFESSNWAWDRVAQAYYWHRFYAHQPDLNYDEPAVRQAMFDVVDHWLGMGVDGLRLDAPPYLYEREGTNCENLPETHAYLKALRRHVDDRYQGRMLLAEANQWPEDARAYFGDGDECHMAFHFPLMPRLFMAIRTEDHLPLLDIQAQTPPIPDLCQWALFLRNHDELTLEMVTEEERLHMYRSYARSPEARINQGIRRRLAPLMNNNRRRIELMNGLLFSLPGTPVIYYGDEIGMGDNIYLGDRNGVRTPMQWSADRNAGFSQAHPQQLYLPLIVDPEYHHAVVHVDAEESNRSSLLWFMKRLIALRKAHKAFGRGMIEFLRPRNHRILAFVRQYEDERILVVANLSRFTQGVELDLSACRGLVPVEMFGRTPFWPIGDEPYVLTLGPHAFFWFSLERQHAVELGPAPAAECPPLPIISTRGTWEDVVRGEARSSLERALPDYLRAQHWFGGKARPILSARVTDPLPLSGASTKGYLTLVQVEYGDGGEPDTYLLPLAYGPVEQVQELCADAPNALIARIQERSRGETREGLLYDALWAPDFPPALVTAMTRRRAAGAGELIGIRGPAFREVVGRPSRLPPPRLPYRDLSNTTLPLDERMVLKLYRRVEAGINPELEVGSYLTKRQFRHAPPLAGALQYQRGRGEALVLATLHGYIPHQQSAWESTLEHLRHTFALTPDALADAPTGDLLALAAGEIPAPVAEALDSYLPLARMLGQRTAELHSLLASADQDARLAPLPYTALYRRSLYQSARSLTRAVFRTLRRVQPELPESLHRSAARLLEQEEWVVEQFQPLLEHEIAAMRIRVHGNFHLEQILCTDGDVAIIDFEGETARPLTERHLKRSAFADVAGMLRSFANAAYSVALERQAAAPADTAGIEQHARAWHRWVAAAYLREYLRVMEAAEILPPTPEERAILLRAKLLERAVYELGYELNNRPERLGLPLLGVLELVTDRERPE